VSVFGGIPVRPMKLCQANHIPYFFSNLLDAFQIFGAKQ
jgi:hypothetical protein